MIPETEGTLEDPNDAGKGESGEVARWLMEIELSSKTEKEWRRNAEEATLRYRNERYEQASTTKDRTQFNIFWSNVEVLRPLLYGNTPKTDVRQRYRDQDPVGTSAAQIIERALDTTLELSKFDETFDNTVLDYLIPSRAVARVRFKPHFDIQKDETGQPMMGPDGPLEAMTYAETFIERVPWDRFRRGPGNAWSDVPWIGYEHELTKAELEEQIPGASSKVTYDVTMEGVDKDRAEVSPSVFKRVRVWEIWDKTNKEILFLAPSYKSGFLKREDDKLKLEGFFDCPKPLYAVESGNSLVPIVEFDMYRAQARELDEITTRITRLIKSLKQRGIYDSTVSEIKDLLTASDNEMIATSTGQAAMQAGGIDKAVWMLPIDAPAKVLVELYKQRDAIKQSIYELTGISDILRGATDPNETLGAQQLKAQTGNNRISRRQREVQRFIRDLIRKMAEIISENYTPEILGMMTGIKLPTDAQKQQAQMMQPQAMPGQPPTQPNPQIEQLLQTPSWEDIMRVLRNDLLRSYRIDIETDSTIAADQAAERQQVTELITGIGGFIQNIGPAVEQGAISMNAAKTILNSCLRRFKLGREVEDVLEDDKAQPPPQKPDPEAAKMQAQMQLEDKKLQNSMQLEQTKAQIAAQLDQSRNQSDAQLAQAQQQAQAQQDSEAQRLQAQREIQKLQMEHQAEVQKIMLEHQLAMEQLKADSLNIATSAQTEAIESQAEIAHKEKMAAAQIESDERVAFAKMATDAYVKLSTASMPAEAGAAPQHEHMVAVTSAIGDAIGKFAEAIEGQTAVMKAPRKAIRDQNNRIIGSEIA